MEAIVCIPAERTSYVEQLDRLRELALRRVKSPHTRRAYNQSLEEFFAWCCTSLGAARINRESVIGFMSHLREKGASASTMNVRLAAIRALVSEAELSGQISAEIARPIMTIKGERPRPGNRPGNWMNEAQVRELLKLPDVSLLSGKRDLALLAALFGFGLRRAELVSLTVESFAVRAERWRIPQLIGKGKKARSIGITDEFKRCVDEWLEAAGITEGVIWRSVDRWQKVRGRRLSESAVWCIINDYARQVGVHPFGPHDARRSCAKMLRDRGVPLDHIQELLGHESPETTKRYTKNLDENVVVSACLDILPRRHRAVPKG